MAEIAVKNNVSREYVRQLIKKRIPFPQQLGEQIENYLTPLIEDIITFDSSFWGKIQSDNMLDESLSQTALLVASLIDTHIIVQLEDDEAEYLVRKSLTENVKVKSVWYNLKRIIDLRRTCIEQLDILSLIKEHNVTYHDNVEKLCDMYAKSVRNKYGYEVKENRYIFLLPNALDISRAVENILEQNNRPMSLDDIFNSFNTLFPANKFESSQKLRQYVIRNPNITAKGKTGIYVLNKWTNHFTGTLTEYIEHILHLFNEPMTLDDIVGFAIQEFPKTNKKSVYSLILGNKDDRFIIYENDYIGLSGNQALEQDLKARKILKRHSFDARIAALKEFLTLRKRFPFQSGFDEEEISLGRWVANVLKSNIETTEEQVMALKQLIEENKTLPQNANENRFKEMCDQIKIMVAKNLSLPTFRDNPQEYQWLRNSRERYATYNDNRKLYVEDLLSYLRDYGFYL